MLSARLSLRGATVRRNQNKLLYVVLSVGIYNTTVSVLGNYFAL